MASVGLLPTGTAGGPVGTAGQVLVTGGAVSPDGRAVVLRTYTDAYVFAAPDGDVEAALTSGRRTRIALPPTGQGEGITFSADGRSLLTSTEGVPGAVHEIPLDPAPAAPTTSAAAPARSEPAAGSGGSEGSDLLGTLLLPIAAVVVLGGLVSYVVARR